VLTNTPADFTKMYAEFQNTQQGLFDSSKGLWWRDASFAGKNIYWSRGNGWVAAALTRVLDVLPASDPHRADYVQTLPSMATALQSAQQPSGVWHVNLGDPTRYPGPETSGTPFFTYALVWGANNGILDAATYGPPGCHQGIERPGEHLGPARWFARLRPGHRRQPVIGSAGHRALDRFVRRRRLSAGRPSSTHDDLQLNQDPHGKDFPKLDLLS
jgi:hypothetical protein